MNQTLPNFFIVGAMKSGTTSLYHYLSAHPDVYLSPIKEPNYFCRDIDPHTFAAAYQPREFDIVDYINSGMPKPIHQAYVRDEAQYCALFKPAANKKAIGEASPSYLYSTTAAQHIYAECPNAKIIIILREPIARAYSHYRMDKEIGRTGLSFWQALQQDSRQTKQWGQNSLYIELGYYAEQVQRYLDVFSANQIKILWFDDLKQNKTQLLTELADFLNIDKAGFKYENNEIHNQSRAPRFAALNYWIHRLGIKKFIRKHLPQALLERGKRWFYRTKPKSHIEPDVLVCLSHIYKSEVEKLATLLNKDLSAWLEKYEQL